MTIKQVQLLLAYLGYDPGELDGIWGSKTSAALKQFQSDYGIQADGFPGNISYKALANAVCYGMPEKNVTNASEVAEKNVTNAEKVPEKSLFSADAEQYLQADGCYHIPRGVIVQITKNFNSQEIHCQGTGCCSESVISKRIMEMAQEIRDDLGQPLTIATSGGSGYRCQKHNAEIPGAATNSLHTISEAVDLHYSSPSKLKEVVLRHLKDGEVGLYSWGCHVGTWDRGYISQFNG